MPRIRTIKPEFWSDEKVGTLPLQSRLIYIALWNFSDDIGVLKGSTLLLKAQILPYDHDVLLSTFIEWFNTLIEKDLLIPFSHKNEQYIYIKNFSTHQKIDKPSKPIIDFDTLSRILGEYSANTPYSNSNSNSSKEIVNSIGIGNRKKEFSPPVFDEVFFYFKEKKIDHGWEEKKSETEAKKFIDHYSSNGWMVGQNKMTVWKAAASGWITRDKKFTESKPIKNGTGVIPDYWNEKYFNTLTGPEVSEYYKKLHEAGLKPHYISGKLVDFRKPQIIPSKDLLTPLAVNIGREK